MGSVIFIFTFVYCGCVCLFLQINCTKNLSVQKFHTVQTKEITIFLSLSCSLSFQVYDFPPSVSKDVSNTQPIREETYDVPPHFSKVKHQIPVPAGQYLHNNLNNDDDPPIPEDVYDIPPSIVTDKHFHADHSGVSHAPQEIYDIPASLRAGGHPTQDVYDFPREREEKGGEQRDNYVYDVPPQVGELKGQSHILGKILDNVCFQSPFVLPETCLVFV